MVNDQFLALFNQCTRLNPTTHLFNQYTRFQPNQKRKKKINALD